MKVLTRAFLLSTLALPLSADPVADVRTALKGLTAREPIRATYEMQKSTANEGKFDNDKIAGKATVELQGDANGLHVVFSRALLDQIDREQQSRAKSTKEKMPTVNALQEVDPVDTITAVDMAPSLLRLLEGAKLLSDTQATWAGKPARTMVLRVADPIDDEDKGRVKVVENKLTLWLGADLVPVAAEHVMNAKLSILLFKGDIKQKESWHLTRVADHLVRTRFEATRASSIFGQKSNENVIATVRVH